MLYRLRHQARSFAEDHSHLIAAAFFAACIACSFAPVLLFPQETLDTLASEDNFYEWFGATCLLLSSILLLLQYVHDTNGSDFTVFRTRRNIFLLLLGMLFLFGFAEEISWGQRILHFDTPEFFMKHNAQQEMNFHNLEIFHGKDDHLARKTGLARFTGMDFLFSVFWFSFGIILPLICRRGNPVRTLVRRLNFPVPALWIGSLMVGAYLTSKLLEVYLPAVDGHSLTEVKECDLELLLYGYSLLLFGQSRAYFKFKNSILQFLDERNIMSISHRHP